MEERKNGMFLAEKKSAITLQFKKNTPIHEIIDEFTYYNRQNITAMGIINNHKIYSNGEDFRDDLIKAYYNLSDEDLKKITSLKEEQVREEDITSRATSFSKHDIIYNFYFNLAKKYILDEHKDDFERKFACEYNNKKFHNILEYLAKMLLIMENKDEHSMCVEFSNFFSNFKTNDEEYELSIAIGFVRNYGKKGNQLDNIIFKNDTEEFIEKQKKITNDLHTERMKIQKFNDDLFHIM